VNADCVDGAERLSRCAGQERQARSIRWGHWTMPRGSAFIGSATNDTARSCRQAVRGGGPVIPASARWRTMTAIATAPVRLSGSSAATASTLDAVRRRWANPSAADGHRSAVPFIVILRTRHIGRRMVFVYWFPGANPRGGEEGGREGGREVFFFFGGGREGGAAEGISRSTSCGAEMLPGSEPSFGVYTLAFAFVLGLHVVPCCNRLVRSHGP